MPSRFTPGFVEYLLVLALVILIVLVILLVGSTPKTLYLPTSHFSGHLLNL
jgi:hypothetical protein